MHIQPYLFFNGQCDEAIAFYKETVGAKVSMLMRFRDCPPPQSAGMDPSTADKVMHASMTIGESVIMLSDGRCQGNAKFEGFSLSIAAPNETEGKRLFSALAQGGKITMPLAKTFFSPCFGMLTDRFGVGWMVIAEH